jgi:hypothetical protein
VDLPTYTNIWRIEKRLYKLYDFRLPAPLPISWIAVFTGITVPYVLLLVAIGLPFNHNLVWLYVLPPGLLTWLTTRPVIENKRLPELLVSQVRYLTEPRVWCRLAPLDEKDEVVVVAQVWHSRRPATAKQSEVARRGRGEVARRSRAVLMRRSPERPAAPVAAPGPLAAAAPKTTPPTKPGRLERLAATTGNHARIAPPLRPAEVRQPEVHDVELPQTPQPERNAAAEQPTRVRDVARSGRRPSVRVEVAHGERSVSSLDSPPAAEPDHQIVAFEPPKWPHGVQSTDFSLAPSATDETTTGDVAPFRAANGMREDSAAPPARDETEIRPAAEDEVSATARVTLAPLGAAPHVTPRSHEPMAPQKTRREAPPLPLVREAFAPAAPAPPARNTTRNAAQSAVSPSRPASVAAAAPARTTPPAGARPVPSIERALARPGRGATSPDWHGKVKVVTGATQGPGKRDQETLDRDRARLGLSGPKRILFLGCTSGAGQTVTALMTGYILASLREHPVAAVDLHDGALGRHMHPAADVAALLDGGVPDAPPATALDGLPPGARSDGNGTRAPDGRLDVITAGSRPPGRRETSLHDAALLARRLGEHYPLAMLDPGPNGLTRLLAVADQLVIVVPASGDAAPSLTSTRDWLEAHGFGELAGRSVTLINGVSRRSMPDVETAESVARGRCRAIVRVPWDDALPVGAAGPTALLPQTRVAYTALAGVLVAGMAAGPVRSVQ